MILKIQNIGNREEQQDCVDIFQDHDTVFLVLADGMGGHSGGVMASNALVESAKEKFEYIPQNITSQFFDEVVKSSSLKISEYKNDHPNSDPHTTCVMALIKNGMVHHAHIGDSRLYVFSDGKLYKRTKDHSYVQMLLEMEEIEESEINSHPDRNRVLKSVSSTPQKCAYSKLELPKDPAVLVCSDGFWEQVSVEEMEQALYSNDIENKIENLVALAKQRADGNSDNISVAVWKE
jgi:serine/threonine protein phosphatase PrpC